jgi:CPA2 family monovalent cation:H+ antiporter-2
MAAVSDLAGVPLFASAEAAELEQVAPLFDVQLADEGVRLVNEGASGYFFFVVVDGGAVVTVGEDIVATFGPGDFFGELAILEGARRSATVTTTSPSKLLVMHGTQFRRFQQEHPGIAAAIEDVTQQRKDELLALQQQAES